MRRSTDTDRIFCTIVFVGVPTQRGASEPRFGFADQAVLCQIISKLSLCSWLLQGSGFMVCPSVFSQHMPHTNFARVRPEALFGSPCVQPSHPLRLLVTKWPSSATSMLVGGSVCSSANGTHDKEARTGTVPCSGTPWKGATWLRLPPLLPTGTAWTSSHGTERRVDCTCFSHKMARSSGHHVHSQAPSAPCEERCRPRMCCCASSACGGRDESEHARILFPARQVQASLVAVDRHVHVAR